MGRERGDGHSTPCNKHINSVDTSQRRHNQRLLVDLLLDLLGSVGLLGRDVAADVDEGLVANLENGGDGRLALANVALLGVLLGLGVVDAEDVVAALAALLQGQHDQVLGLIVDLGGGLLDQGNVLVDAVEGLVAQRVGTLHVGSDPGGEGVVGLGEKRQERTGKSLVGRVTKLDGSLSVRVAGDGRDAVVDERVVEQVLELLVSASFFFRSTRVQCCRAAELQKWHQTYLEESRVVSRARDVAVDLGSHCVCVARVVACVVSCKRSVSWMRIDSTAYIEASRGYRGLMRKRG